MAVSIDLNADLGESDDPADIARDIALMQVISSCNIACGGHAGTPETMALMLDAAIAAEVNAGAHPGYPDRAGFGRTRMHIAPDALCASLVEQVQALIDIAGLRGVTLTHIKPHGALYNDIADDAEMAEAVTKALSAAFPHLALVGLAHGAMEAAAARHGVRYIGEAFIDRAYQANARLVPRSQTGAVIADDAVRVAQALALAGDGHITTASGVVTITAHSLCIHSDSPGALQTARAVREALEAAGHRIAAP